MIILVTHCGLGDLIGQTGMAVELSRMYGEIAFPCYDFYEESVRSFFVNYPQIKVYTMPYVPGEAWGAPPDHRFYEAIRRNNWIGEPMLRLGCYSHGYDDDFLKSFYHHAAVDFHHRYDSCPLDEAAKSVDQVIWPGITDRNFGHDDPWRGYNITGIDKSKYFWPSSADKTKSILRYVNLIKTADRIDVIDSSFFQLVNVIPGVDGEKFVHRYARWPRPMTFMYENRYKWTSID